MAVVAAAAIPVAAGLPGPGRFNQGRAVGSNSAADATRSGQAFAMARANAAP
jgi:hypothetical protein